MRVLSFIFAFVAALGLVAALPAAPLEVASAANGLDAYCGPLQNATTHLTTVQGQLAVIAAAVEADIEVNAVVALVLEAAAIVLFVVGQIKAVVGVSLSVELAVLVEAIVALFGAVVLTVEALLAIVLRLPLSVAVGLVACLNVFLSAVVGLVASLQFAAVGPLAGILLTLFATVKAFVLVFVRACVAAGIKVAVAL